jgi:hypothetical protein
MVRFVKGACHATTLSVCVYFGSRLSRGHPADGVDRSSQRTGPGDPRTVHARASRRGAKVYAQTCASCHGVRLDDGQANALVGPKFLDVDGPGPHARRAAFHHPDHDAEERGCAPDGRDVAVLAYLL